MLREGVGGEGNRATRLPAIVSVGHGADETPGLGSQPSTNGTRWRTGAPSFVYSCRIRGWNVLRRR
jgi:hypothetical protein